MSESRDPYEMLRGERERRRQFKEAMQAERQQAEAWVDGWIEAVAQLRLDSFLKLGQILREARCGCWLDWWEVSLAREKRVLDEQLRPGFSLNAGLFAADLIVLELLKAAFLEEEATVGLQLLKARQAQVLDEVTEGVLRARESAERWRDERMYLSTPFMSRKELAEAIGIKLGHSGLATRSGITKAIERGTLRVTEETSKASDGRTIFARFGHVDPLTHRQILYFAVEFLKSSQNDCFFSGPRWTAENDGI